MIKRLSSHDLDRLIALAEVYQRNGWQVARPIYVDWFWRGYSLLLERQVPLR